jgi:hypothetical protein
MHGDGAMISGRPDRLTGKRLFDGFTQSLDLEYFWVRQSRYATFIHYRVTPPA